MSLDLQTTDHTIPKDKIHPDYKTPPMYAVVFNNDDFTTMDFVVDLLMENFHLPSVEALEIMFDVHEEGKAIAGVFTKDIAETKAAKCNSEARVNGHPLLVTISQN
jgi:ATP-dependent Clp protease adaptor protein ClpS